MKHFKFLTVLFLFISCAKSNNQPINTCDQITQVYDPHPYGPIGPPTAVFTYDEQGRVIHVKGQLQNQTSYTYYNDSIVMSATDIYGVDIGTTYYLDNQHRIIRTKFYDWDFQYNADGYMISCKIPYGNNGQITGFTPKFLNYTNGNLTQVTTTDPNAVPQKISFGYYDEPDQDLMGYNSPLYISEILGDRNSFILIKAGFFGKQSKNLYKTLDWNSVYYPPGTVGYDKDSSGRIIGLQMGFSFTYRCP
jgi:YD repeat-containing protein